MKTFRDRGCCRGIVCVEYVHPRAGWRCVRSAGTVLCGWLMYRCLAIVVPLWELAGGMSRGNPIVA